MDELLRTVMKLRGQCESFIADIDSFDVANKDCFIIQYNFSDGSEPVLISEGDNFNWKGFNWWNDVNVHKRNEPIIEVEHNVETDSVDDFGKRVTMSVMAISIPKTSL